MRENAWEFRDRTRAPQIHSVSLKRNLSIISVRSIPLGTSTSCSMRLVHVGVFFDRTHQFRDSRSAGFNLSRESFSTNRRHNALENLEYRISPRNFAPSRSMAAPPAYFSLPTRPDASRASLGILCAFSHEAKSLLTIALFESVEGGGADAIRSSSFSSMVTTKARSSKESAASSRVLLTRRSSQHVIARVLRRRDLPRKRDYLARAPNQPTAYQERSVCRAAVRPGFILANPIRPVPQ